PQAHRIQMNVAGYFHHPSLILDHNGLESALEDRPALVVRPVEPAAVTDIEPTDGMTEVGLGGAHHQLIMVVHEHEGMDLQLDEKSRSDKSQTADNGSWSLSGRSWSWVSSKPCS